MDSMQCEISTVTEEQMPLDETPLGWDSKPVRLGELENRVVVAKGWGEGMVESSNRLWQVTQSWRPAVGRSARG